MPGIINGVVYTLIWQVKTLKGIILPERLLALTDDWKVYLKEAQGYADNEIKKHERTGRPLGNEHFIEEAERLLRRVLKKKKPGPKSDNNQFS